MILQFSILLAVDAFKVERCRDKYRLKQRYKREGAVLLVAHLDVLLEVLDTPICFMVFWPPTSVHRHLPHPVKFMQRLLGEVFHSVHVFCSDPPAFTPVVNIEARERGNEG